MAMGGIGKKALAPLCGSISGKTSNANPNYERNVGATSQFFLSNWILISLMRDTGMGLLAVIGKTLTSLYNITEFELTNKTNKS